MRIPLPNPPVMHPADLKVKQLRLQAAANTYGIPGHQRVCDGCGYRRYMCRCDGGPA